MRVLLDEDLRRRLTRLVEAAGHDADHVESLGWRGVTNGNLLARASGLYDVLMTGDTNMSFQQDLARFDIAIVLLHPRLKLVEQLQALMPTALERLASAPRGAVTIVKPG